METRLFVYELRFAERAALCRAFDRVDSDPGVASCAFEVAARRIRLLAEARVAEPIVERLYLEGGLAWCARHACVEPPERGVQAPSRIGSRSRPRRRFSRVKTAGPVISKRE